MMSVKNKAEELKNRIISGEFGGSGDLFLSIRELAESEGISYVSAQRVTAALRNMGLVMLCGNHQYVTRGPIKRSSALSHYLRKRRPERKRIGMHINKLTNVFFSSIARHISDELLKKGYELVVLSGNGSFEREKQALESFVMMGVEAVISCPGFNEEIGEVYKNYILPTVFIGRTPLNMENCSAVLVNNVDAGRQVAMHLAESGCKSFVYVGTSQLKNQSDMRLEGYREQLALLGMSLDEQNVIAMDADDPSQRRAKIRDRFNNLEKPIGVFCYHDMLALSVVGICNRYGIHIPNDVKLVGFDDLALCEAVSPSLSSISYRFDKMAMSVVELVFELIKSPDKYLGERYINQSLVIRKSTQGTAAGL
ncbi:MAG: substrate-binding domain-containing protein [Oscillospiraceae bacterium]|nr:substrate-binding domain-containing protein [Oscillospiraceae bacterium]